MAMYRSIESEVKDIGKEGLPITAGLIGSSALGLYVESYINKTPVTADSTLVQKITSAVANNLPKLLAYQGVGSIAKGTTGENIKSGILAGVAFDSILRIANKGVNPIQPVVVGGYRILEQGAQQKLVQENSLLRNELNKALTKLANPDTSADFRYGGSPSPAVEARQRQFGSMPTPDVMERQRRYGAMPFEQHPGKTSREKTYGFMSYPNETKTSATFGMQ